MQEFTRLLIGVLILFLGFPIGTYLARNTKEELKSGQIWFKVIILISLIGGVFGLVNGNDVWMFAFFFIAIVTSRSLRK